MSKVDVSQAADIRAVLGASGTGKSHYVKASIAKDRRLLVWDIEDEYPHLPALPLSELPQAFAGRKPIKARFICASDAGTRARQFDLFCKIAFACGNLRLVVEELRFVTTASRAPDGWAAITLRGRKRGIRTIGTSQRPAQIDKDFLGNCNLIRCGALEYPEDRKAVAPILRASLEEIAALEGYQCLIYQRGAAPTASSSTRSAGASATPAASTFATGQKSPARNSPTKPMRGKSATG